LLNSFAELAIGNIVRRVLHLIREEAQTEKSDEDVSSPSEIDCNPGVLSRNARMHSHIELGIAQAEALHACQGFTA